MKKIFFIVILLTGVVGLSSSAQESISMIRSKKIERINGDNFYIHTVKKGQTLYMISKAYDIDINVIIQENPEVKQGLKSGQKLRIPAPPTVDVNNKQSKTKGDETKPVVKTGADELPPCGKDKSSMKSSYNVALMMPLYLSDVVNISVESNVEATVQDNRSLQFVEYYEGFRMALDSLEKIGISLNVKVYDAERDTLKTFKMLQDPELKNMDLIFGILYPHNFQIVSDFAEKNNIPIVNPISERDQIIENHKFVYKVKPSLKTQFSAVIKYLQKNFKDSNIVVISDNQKLNKGIEDNLLTTLEDKKADVHMADGYGEVLSLLSSKKANIIILISESKSFVLDVVTKLNEHRNEYRITLLGLPRWDRFDDIEADYLVNLKTYVMAPYFIDYDNPLVKRFVSMFQEKYQTDPDPLAFQGFDNIFYFANVLSKYGKNFSRCIPEFRMKSLQTDFHFTSAKDNGFENQYWEMYEFDNYHLRRIVLK
jgi:ABC-type branched-subunit amino acid transport system substrate-binding protein/LysM repeat protein